MLDLQSLLLGFLVGLVSGTIIGVVISLQVYEFFLKKEQKILKNVKNYLEDNSKTR